MKKVAICLQSLFRHHQARAQFLSHVVKIQSIWRGRKPRSLATRKPELTVAFRCLVERYQVKCFINALLPSLIKSRESLLEMIAEEELATLNKYLC